MANFLFNKFGNPQNQNNNINTISNTGSNDNNNILSWIAQLNNSPGGILDILLKNGKINQTQYNELLPYKNNHEIIVKYLINNGKAGEIQQAQSIASGIK